MSNLETCSLILHKRGKNFKMKIRTCCSSSQTFGHIKFHKLNKKVNSEFGSNFGSQTKQMFIQTHKTHHGPNLRKTHRRWKVQYDNFSYIMDDNN